MNVWVLTLSGMRPVRTASSIEIVLKSLARVMKGCEGVKVAVIEQMIAGYRFSMSV